MNPLPPPPYGAAWLWQILGELPLDGGTSRRGRDRGVMVENRRSQAMSIHAVSASAVCRDLPRPCSVGHPSYVCPCA